MSHQRWQYKTLQLKTPAFSTVDQKAEQIDEMLNRVGLEGWELVSITHDSMHMWAFLKKPS